MKSKDSKRCETIRRCAAVDAAAEASALARLPRANVRGDGMADGNRRRVRGETGPMTLDSLFRRFAFGPLPVPQDWFAIPLRLIVGFGFIEHGYAKLARG